MKIAYTVCTLNRLGQIKTLSETLFLYNPEYIFFACLADEINDRIDIKQFPEIKFIPLSDLSQKTVNELTTKYDLFELSCALKAYFGNFLMQEYDPEILIYFDTDIAIYNNFQQIENSFGKASILLTPHFTTPIPGDGKFPIERDVLNSGLYNGGFLGLRNDDSAKRFLQWWQKKVYNEGFNKVCEGMMVDQLWLNLVPLYFNTQLLLHTGCNVAYWNLHERKLSVRENTFTLNNDELIFFHFSGFKIESPHLLSIHQNRFNLDDNPALQQLVKTYELMLKKNEFLKYSVFDSCYKNTGKIKRHSLPKRMLMKTLAAFGYSLEKIRKLN